MHTQEPVASGALLFQHPIHCRCAECALIRREDRAQRGPEAGDIEIAVCTRRPGARIVTAASVTAG